MPPITLAFVDPDISIQTDRDSIAEYVNANIGKGYILDGLQRLNTLSSASTDESFDASRPLFLTIIIAEKYDLLLYRMITLNNGQKPMTARHQIEMLTQPLLEKLISDFKNISVISEKETEGTVVPGSFRKSSVVEAYTAYLSNNLHNQNSKIIEQKLDEIIVGRVMESGLEKSEHSFEEILKEIDRLSSQRNTKQWFQITNNMIGFSVGAKESLPDLRAIQPEVFEQSVDKFERGFLAINPSKVNIGKFRRELSCLFVKRVSGLAEADVEVYEELFLEETMSE